MSRDNRDRWKFYASPSRPALAPEEVRYWKAQLLKILKVGFEFEFNLPEKNGTCKGDNNACPCQHMKVDTCWQECIRSKECEEKAAEAKRVFTCSGLMCTGFISQCVRCEKFSSDCGSCENRFDPAKNPDAIREHITQQLRPSNSYGIVNRYGVHSITTDGSLLGKKGAEIITVGRRPDYWEFFKMAQSIIKLASDSSAYVNERCSIHAHMLASYYGKAPGDNGPNMPSLISEMERDMPELILANFHQLCRRYQNAITWMTTGLNNPKQLTRWEKFRVSVLGISPATQTMAGVKNEVQHTAGEKNKYGWVNYLSTMFAENGDVHRLHVEMRVMDGLMSPSAVAAFGCLYTALMIKAVEISRYGLLNVGDKEWLEEALQVKDCLMNNCKGWQDGDRFSDTRNLEKYYGYLIRESFELVAQLKHVLIKFGPCYDILEKLAEKPCSLRRIAGQDWNEIEAALAVPQPMETIIDARVSEIIDTRQIDQCADEGEWVTEAARILMEDKATAKMELNGRTIPEVIQEYLARKKRDGEVLWFDKVGTMALV
jgi:hypothetical protein